MLDSERNEAARREAMAAIVQVIDQAAEALELNGRPGIKALTGSIGHPPSVDGWEVQFGKPDPSVSKPDLRLANPECHCHQPRGWFAGVFGDGHISDAVLVARFGRYQIATRSPRGFTDYTRGQWAWEVWTPPEFAERLLCDGVVWRCQCRADQEFSIAGRADPQEYRRYVLEVARVVAAGFHSLASAQLSRLEKTHQNKQARNAALAQMVEVIGNTSAALQAAGNPGAGPVDPEPPHSEQVHGWRVTLDWSAFAQASPVVTPPEMEKRVGNWSSLEVRPGAADHVALLQNGEVAVPQRSSHFAWKTMNPPEFASWVLQDWIFWWSWDYRPTSFIITDYTEPAQYIPYVEGVARVVANGFRSIE